MKKILFICTLAIGGLLFGQKELPYNPKADAKKDLQTAFEEAEKESKIVMVQIGGNWCQWCIVLNAFIESDSELKSILDEKYVNYHLNYSPDNRNQEILDSYGNPEKNGFPVFIFLDSKGNLVYTQNTGELEEGKSYNREKLKELLENIVPEVKKRHDSKFKTSKFM